jgi:hypothetical protein
MNEVGGDRIGVFTGGIGHHKKEIVGASPVRPFRSRPKGFGVRLHITSQLVLHETEGHLVVKRIGVFDIANRILDLVDVDGDAFIALAADANRPFDGHTLRNRALHVYVDKNPKQPIDALRGEFIKYVLSKEGQERTVKGGFYPITNDIRIAELKKL